MVFIKKFINGLWNLVFGRRVCIFGVVVERWDASNYTYIIFYNIIFFNILDFQKKEKIWKGTLEKDGRKISAVFNIVVLHSLYYRGANNRKSLKILKKSCAENVFNYNALSDPTKYKLMLQAFCWGGIFSGPDSEFLSSLHSCLIGDCGEVFAFYNYSIDYNVRFAVGRCFYPKECKKKRTQL